MLVGRVAGALMMVLGLNGAENIQWQSMLRNLAAHFGANGEVETRVICTDPRRQWRHYKNISHNVLVRSSLRAPSDLVRKISDRARRCTTVRETIVT